MKRLLPLFALVHPLPALAEGFARPVPQPQSATAEISFAIASLALIAALVMVWRLVSRR